MTTNRVDFASLLASRLCHDLLSPVGAFANGLELLADEPDADMRKRCFELLEQSARASTNKLKFFRLAFGSAGGFGDMIPAEEVRSAIAGLMSEGRPVTFNWMIADDQLPKPVVKVILNLALVMVDALIRGGRLDVGCERRGDVLEIALRAEGERLIIDKEVEQVLANGMNGITMTSRTAPAALVQAIADEHQGQVMLSRETPTALLVGAVLRNF